MGALPWIVLGVLCVISTVSMRVAERDYNTDDGVANLDA